MASVSSCWGSKGSCFVVRAEFFIRHPPQTFSIAHCTIHSLIFNIEASCNLISKTKASWVLQVWDLFLCTLYGVLKMSPISSHTQIFSVVVYIPENFHRAIPPSLLLVSTHFSYELTLIFHLFSFLQLKNRVLMLVGLLFGKPYLCPKLVLLVCVFPPLRSSWTMWVSWSPWSPSPSSPSSLSPSRWSSSSLR